MRNLYLLLILLFSQLNPAITSAADESNIALLQIRHADFIASDALIPPSFDRSSRVDLPYHWPAQDFRSGWFQITFPVTSNQNLSLYLPRVNMNAAVFLNGKFVGGGVRMEPPVDRYWHSPMLVQLPQSPLQRGENIIQIHVVASQPGTVGMLGRVVLGPDSVIKPLYEWDYFIYHGISLATVFLSLLIGVIVLFLWWMRRESEYLWLGIFNLVAAFSYLNSVVVFIPVSTHVWEWLMQSSIGWVPLFMALFIHHLIGIGRTKIDVAVISIGFVFIPLLWFVPPQSIFAMAKIWHMISLGAGLLALVELILFLYRSKSGALYIICICVAVLAVCGIHDLFTVMADGARFWLTYSPLVIIFGISILLIQRFAAATDALETANVMLESRVAAAQKKIEHDMELIAAMEKEQAVNQERSRIYRDLHDDLGAKILSLVYKSENSEQKMLAREAMDQLRKIVSRSETRAVKLNNMIRFWREDCVRRAVEAGISVMWKLRECAGDIELDAHTVSQVSYVFREAITNALKHGSGKQLHIRTRCWRGHFIISIRNESPLHCGTALHDLSGNGIDNMRNRIESLGGRIRWRSGGFGWRVIWEVPLEGAHADTDI